jgi:hypothetical protein
MISSGVKEVADLKRYSAPTVTPQAVAWDGKHSECGIRISECGMRNTGAVSVVFGWPLKARTRSSLEAVRLAFLPKDCVLI